MLIGMRYPEGTTPVFIVTSAQNGCFSLTVYLFFLKGFSLIAFPARYLSPEVESVSFKDCFDSFDENGQAHDNFSVEKSWRRKMSTISMRNLFAL